MTSPTARQAHVPRPLGEDEEIRKPWTVDDPPPPALNWTADEKARCVAAANAALARNPGDERGAVFACIAAAGRSRRKSVTTRIIDKMKRYYVNDRLVTMADLAGAWLEKQERDKLRAAREARARRYGIGAKENGSLTYPKGFPTSDGEYGDPVNYAYPADAAHARAALSYFNHSGQMQAGGYTPAEWAKVGQRLARLVGRHLQADYEYRGGKLQQRGQAQKELRVDILAKEAKRQVAYGVILRPNVPDADGDLYDEAEVEKAARDYMARTGGAADWLHEQELDKGEAVLVESVLMGCDVDRWHGQKCDLRKGDWLGGMHVPDPEMWGKIEQGDVTAFSIRGYGKRRPLK